jgi:hypothetical protein
MDLSDVSDMEASELPDWYEAISDLESVASWLANNSDSEFKGIDSSSSRSSLSSSSSSSSSDSSSTSSKTTSDSSSDSDKSTEMETNIPDPSIIDPSIIDPSIVEVEAVEPEKQKKPPYKFRDRRILETSREMSEEDFQRLYRMPRRVFDLLFDEMFPYLPPGLSPNKMSITAKERLFAFLFFASGSIPNRHSSYAHNMSYGAISESITICIDVLHSHLVPNYIRLPTASEAREEAQLFNLGSGFPPIVWGAVDGTHIRVR